MTRGLPGEALWGESERERTGDPCTEWQTLLLDLVGQELNQLLELLKLRRHPLKQLL